MEPITQIATLDLLIPTLAPLIQSWEGVFICLQNTYPRVSEDGVLENAYHAIVLTQTRIIYGSQDYPSSSPPEGKLREAISLGEISKISRYYTYKEHIPQLVIYQPNGEIFTRIEFSSENIMGTFINALKNLGLVVKPAESSL